MLFKPKAASNPKRQRSERGLHEHETPPLHANLRDTQQGSGASLARDFLTAGDILSALWKYEYVPNGCYGGETAQKHPPWRETFRRAPSGDFDVLREVGDDDAGDEECS